MSGIFEGQQYSQLTYLNVTQQLRINGVPVIAGGVSSVTGGNVDNTDPMNPVVNALVETVTGTAVDNTDPLNPVVSPTSDEIPNQSAVTGATVTAALDDLLTQQNILMSRMHFVAGAVEDVTVGTDPNNPSFLTDMFLAPGGSGVTIDTPTGAVKNVTGRTIAQAVGTISFQPDKAGGGVTLLHLWSERSMDNGATWIQNSNSLRAIEISNNGETFKTSLSAVLDWENDSLLRFRVYALSGGAVTFSSPTDTVLGGEVIDGYSIAWELGEN